MNNVELPKEKKEVVKLGRVTGKNFDPKKTAFIGKHESYRTELERLYLVTFSGIVLASSPGTTYSEGDTAFDLHRWVDINITIV